MAKIKQPANTSKKEFITAEAARLFRENGYIGTSMRDLAVVLGVEAASLYNHIKSKSELLTTICFKVAERFTGKMDEVEKESGTVLYKIEKLLRFHVHEMVHHYSDVYVSDREWRNMASPHLEDYRDLRRNYRKRFAAIVEQGIISKEIKPLDPNTTVMIFLNAIGAVDQWQRIINKIDSQELENTMVAILTEGIKN